MPSELLIRDRKIALRGENDLLRCGASSAARGTGAGRCGGSAKAILQYRTALAGGYAKNTARSRCESGQRAVL